MPLYAIIYLFLFFLFAFGSTYMHFEEGRGVKYVVAEAISYCFLISFVIMFYQEGESFISPVFVILMLIFSISWEYFSFKQDVEIAKKDFGIRERELILYTSVAAIFVSPVYLAGLALIF